MGWALKYNKAVIVTIACCIFLYGMDALFIGLPGLGVIVSFAALIRNTRSLSGRMREDSPAVRQYGFVSIGFILTIVAIFSTFAFNKHVGYTHAEAIIGAVVSFRSDQGEYPEALDELIPEYLEEIPICAYRFVSSRYTFFESSGSHYLLWEEAPAFGRPAYEFETGQWRYID